MSILRKKYRVISMVLIFVLVFSSVASAAGNAVYVGNVGFELDKLENDSAYLNAFQNYLANNLGKSLIVSTFGFIYDANDASNNPGTNLGDLTQKAIPSGATIWDGTGQPGEEPDTELKVVEVSAINNMTIAANEDVELKFLVNGEEELTKAEFEEKYEGYTVTFKYNRTDSKLKATGEVNSDTSFKYAVQVKDAEGTLIPEELGLEDYLEVKVADADTIATIETVALSNERDYLTVGEEDVKFEIVAAKNALGEDLEEDIFKNVEPTKVVSSDIFVAYYAEDKIVARAVGPVTFTLTYGIGDDAIEVELSVEVKEAGVATRVEAEDQKVALGTEKENLEFKVFDQHDLDITDTDKYSIVVKDEEEKETDLSAKGIFTVEIQDEDDKVIGTFTVTVVDVVEAKYDSFFFEEVNKEVVLDVNVGSRVDTKELKLYGIKDGVKVLANDLEDDEDPDIVTSGDGLYLESSDKDVFTVAYNEGTVTVTLNNDLEKAATAKVQLINKMGSIEITEAELELEVVNTTPQIENLALAEGVEVLVVRYDEDSKEWTIEDLTHLTSTDVKDEDGKLVDLDEEMIEEVVFSANDGKAIVTIADVYGGKEFVFDAIEAVEVKKVSVDPAGLTLPVGDTGQITATVEPEDATNKDVTWESNDENVATVADGVVTAVSEGKATITVTTVDGGFTDTVTVTVVPEGTVAMIDEATYNSLQDAITAAKSDDTINILSDVSFVGVKANGKDLTFMGTDAKPIISFRKDTYETHSSEFTFKNLTLDFAATGHYHGIQPSKLTVENSVINGILWGYAKDIIVTDSVFNQENSYNIWTYASNVTIERSEFNSAGRSVLIYNEGATQDNPAKIVFNECEFINKGEVVSEKAAIEISTHAYPESAGSFIVEINNCSATGFDTETLAGGVVLSPGLAHLKEIGVGTLTVTIDGVEVYPN